MKKDNKYKLAVFEDEDKADLVEYSKQMQKSIEKALDENQGEKGEKGDKGDKGDKGELVDLIKEEEGKNISIESANLPAIEVSIEGESQQATRSGKNLLDNTATTKISNGITFTVNSDKTVNVNGTNDTSANSSLVINRYDLSPGTYILNGCPSGGASNTYRLAIQETGSYSILGSIDIGNGSGEFTIDTTTNVQIAIFIQKGLTINNLLFKPMLREATIADDTYEQYGASPSLDYLSEIENLEGENICPSLNTTRTINGVTFTKNKDGSITMNGTATAETTYPINVNTTTNTRTVLLKANSKYRMLSSYESGKYTTQVFYLKNNATTYSSSLIETVEETKAGMYIRVYKDAVLENVTIYPQITKGEEYKPYVPYNSLEFKDEGENLYNDNIDNYNKPIDYWICPVALEQGETYKLSGKLKGTKMTGCVVAVVPYGNSYSEFKDVVYRYTALNTSGIVSNKTITVDSSFTSPKLVIYANNKEIFKSLFENYEIQLNKGTVAKPYEPHKQQTEYFPLSEGQKLYKGSYLASDRIHHKRKQYTFTGNEVITLSNRQYENCACFYIDNQNIINKQNNYITKEMCSHFVYDSLAYKENRDVECITDNAGIPYRLIIFQILKTRLTSIDVAGFKAYLAEQYANGTPVIVEYELAEEEIVPYTDDQKEAWEKIKNMILYKGTNHISCTGKLKIKYYTNEEMNEIYAKKEDLHEHANKSILDQTQEAFTTELKNKLDGLNNYVLPAPTSTTLGGVKAGSNITIDADGTINAQLGSSGETSANNYEVLSNKPQIAGITLQGNKSLADLGIQGVETGKGLSSNDYTTKEKAKLAGVEAQANKYIHPNTSGNKHVPSGGSSGQVLKWKSDGTAQWDNLSSSGELGTDDLNSKKINGIYAQSTATNFLKSRNYPFDHADGFPFFDILLEVKNAGMYIMQELHLSYKISVQGQEVISYFTYMRFSTNNGSTWSAWRGHEGTTTQ